ncbi:MAG: hypothetical protein RMY34_27920, partial [Aulosira sp. DedQUE10]|nr:hypothetical protein [Aulosira sp. DedQUE10]
AYASGQGFHVKLTRMSNAMPLQQFSCIETTIMRPNPQPLPYKGRGENQSRSPTISERSIYGVFN